MGKINVLSLFSGGGGLDLGFAAAGFKPVFSSDIDYFSCETLLLNQRKQAYYSKHPVMCEDVKQLSHKVIRKTIGHHDIDLIIGGPPCQAFSVFGRRKGLDDPRGNLVYEYARIVEEIKPEGFLFENVAGLKTIHGGALYAELLDVLTINGVYTISAHEYNMADYGIPQFRKRVFFIGSKSNNSIPKMKPTHAAPDSTLNLLEPYITVSSILADLPTPITSWKEQTSINAHVGRKHSQRIIDRYKSLRFGERDHKTRINRLSPNRPSFTIIVGSDAGGGKGHVHPYEPREVTPRESARLQTFPDWWEFHGTGRHVIRQVGNAVPPLFAAILARHVAKTVFGKRKKPNMKELVEKLELGYM